MKLKQTHRRRDQTCGHQAGVGRGGLGLECRVSRCKLSHTERVNSKAYCIAQGTVFSSLR